MPFKIPLFYTLFYFHDRTVRYYYYFPHFIVEPELQRNKITSFRCPTCTLNSVFTTNLCCFSNESVLTATTPPPSNIVDSFRWHLSSSWSPGLEIRPEEEGNTWKGPKGTKIRRFYIRIKKSRVSLFKFSWVSATDSVVLRFLNSLSLCFPFQKNGHTNF